MAWVRREILFEIQKAEMRQPYSFCAQRMLLAWGADAIHVIADLVAPLVGVSSSRSHQISYVSLSGSEARCPLLHGRESPAYPAGHLPHRPGGL